MPKIANVHARQILDSRGNPTVEVDVFTENFRGRAAVPSGASTGIHEAVELRDGDNHTFLGKGVLKAVNNVDTIIKEALIGQDIFDQITIDQTMLDLDGTPNKSKLGANAILGVSIACTKAAAQEKKISLYNYFAELSNNPEGSILPIPMMNIINGGQHADSGLEIQEFMIVPTTARNFAEALQWGSEIFHNLKKILKNKGHITAVGDEGGFAPHLNSNREALEIIMQTIQVAGLEGKIKIALDCAASEFFKDGKYLIENQKLSAVELSNYYVELVNNFPIISIEDSHSEDDFSGFADCVTKLGDKIQLVGDDIFVTNTKRIQIGIDQKLANSVLIKLNQIGTVTETIKAIKLTKKAGWTSIVSHRSGETEDTSIADFCVGLGTGQIKTGSLSRTDRICKYNQLLRIEEELGKKAKYGI